MAQVAVAQSTETFVYHHEFVLGTSLEVHIEAESESAADLADWRILAEIERLSAIFSTYDSKSEFSRWQRGAPAARAVSPELLEILAAADRWREQSGGAFQPGAEALSQLWKLAEARGTPPTDDELRTAVALANRPHWRIEGATVTRLSDCPLSLNAIAKGAIVEWACRAAVVVPDVRGLVVNLGGDLRVIGDAVREVSIADPRNDAVNARPADRVFIANRAVATSGDYRRGFRIGETWYSHIIDPRNGRPAGHIASATVVARSSADADALATICNVLPPQEGLALIESLDDVECLLIATDGRQHRSAGWAALASPRLFRFADLMGQSLALADETESADDTLGPPAAEPAAEAAPAPDAQAAPLHELVVKFELDRPPGVQYRRPYVAIWLEDADQFPVKTALLWMQTKEPGPRWHRDLLRWYRNDGVRKLADNTELIGTVSSATRGPGQYKVVFDGTDDAGAPLKPGRYTLFLEVVREKGSYQLTRRRIQMGADPIPETALKSNVEVKSASFEYRPRPADAAVETAP